LTRHTSFVALFEPATVGCILVFGAYALVAAPNDLVSIAKCICIATGVAPFVAACFAVPVWLVLKVAG